MFRVVWITLSQVMGLLTTVAIEEVELKISRGRALFLSPRWRFRSLWLLFSGSFTPGIAIIFMELLFLRGDRSVSKFTGFTFRVFVGDAGGPRGSLNRPDDFGVSQMEFFALSSLRHLAICFFSSDLISFPVITPGR